MTIKDDKETKGITKDPAYVPGRMHGALKNSK